LRRNGRRIVVLNASLAKLYQKSRGWQPSRKTDQIVKS
jgi:hypothetical protein